MAKNITLMGASYSDVPAVDLPQTGGGTARFVDTSDANATQYALLEGATAYVNGNKITGVIPQMTQYTGDMSQYFHTENNQRKWSFEGIIRTDQGGVVNPGASFGTGSFTYDAVPANTVITPTSQAQTVGGANWMMEGAITINPASGGASNFVTGTFKGTDAQKGTALNLTLPYTGSGYPIAVVICPTEGAYNSASGSFYNLIQRYAIAQYAMTKSRIDTAPTYGTSGANNYGVVTLIYKSSASSATTYNRGGSMYADSYSSSPATQTNTQTVRFNSNNKMSVFIASNNNYGFAAGIEYTYRVIYSE